MSTPGQNPVVRVRATFEGIADVYDQSGVPFFVPTAQGLVEALEPVAGERALDIGCGRGAVTVLLGRAVLPSGHLEAVDLSPAMVEHTRSLLEREGLAADLRVLDASDPDLPDAAYDVLASSLVLFFLSDPATALTAWGRLLAPGGRIGIATMGEEHPSWQAVNALFRPWLPPGLLDPKLADPHGYFASDAGVEALFTGAGLEEVRTVTRRVPVPWGDVDGWRRFSMGTGQRAMWGFVPEDEQDALVARAAEILQDARDEDGRIVAWQDMRYTLGRAARSSG